MLGKVQALEFLEEWNGLLGVNNKSLNVCLPNVILAYVLMACMQLFLVSFCPRKSSDVPDSLCQKHHFSLCPANTFLWGCFQFAAFRNICSELLSRTQGRSPSPPPPFCSDFPVITLFTITSWAILQFVSALKSEYELKCLVWGSEQLAPEWPSW